MPTKPFASRSAEHLLTCHRGELVCLRASLLLRLPSSPSLFYSLLSSSITRAAGGTRRMWRFHWIKNLRAIKSRPMPGIHQPCVLLPGWVRGTCSKPQAIYFYICFPFKEGRLWQNYVLLSQDFHCDVDIFQETDSSEVRVPEKEAGKEKYVCAVFM